ncbi:MAG: hypothetical protein ACO2O5_10605 [Candidatus Caldipriscus sp.]
MREVKEILDKIIAGKKTGVLRVNRKNFQDPLLHVTFLKGVPLYAYSFLVKDRWYDGLLSREEVENNLFGNIFEYAFKNYGEKYLQHITEYSKNVIQKALKGAAENGWQLEAEFIEEDEDTVREMVGITRAKSDIEAFAKTLTSLGAKQVYLPKKGKKLGYGDAELDEIYEFLTKTFGECDAIVSTPFANIFIIHKFGNPIIFSTDNLLVEELEENLKNLIIRADKVSCNRDIEGGINFPIFKGIGKPFLVAIRKDEEFLTLYIKKDSFLADKKPIERVLSSIFEINEKLSIAVYESLSELSESETTITSQDIIDMKIKILLMKFPNPEDFREAFKKEKF